MGEPRDQYGQSVDAHLRNAARSLASVWAIMEETAEDPTRPKVVAVESDKFVFIATDCKLLLDPILESLS